MINNDYFEPAEDFDFDSIYNKEEQVEEVDYLKESIVLGAILDFVFKKRFKKNSALRRMYAILFICRPHYFNGKPNITQVEVAEILGVTKQIFNAHVSEFRRTFKFHINGMRNQSALDKFSKITKARAGELAEARRKARERKRGGVGLLPRKTMTLRFKSLYAFFIKMENSMYLHSEMTTLP